MVVCMAIPKSSRIEIPVFINNAFDFVFNSSSIDRIPILSALFHPVLHSAMLSGCAIFKSATAISSFHESEIILWICGDVVDRFYDRKLHPVFFSQ